MPTYEYRCAACGHEMEEFQSITAAPLKKCPACKKSKLKRLIGTGAGIIFKGSGFYETDYRSDSYKQAAKADREGGAPKSETKSDAKSDGKSESKSESSKPAETPAKPAPKAESKLAKAEKPAKK